MINLSASCILTPFPRAYLRAAIRVAVGQGLRIDEVQFK